jgi:hypothetical protein
MSHPEPGRMSSASGGGSARARSESGRGSPHAGPGSGAADGRSTDDPGSEAAASPGADERATVKPDAAASALVRREPPRTAALTHRQRVEVARRARSREVVLVRRAGPDRARRRARLLVPIAAALAFAAGYILAQPAPKAATPVDALRIESLATQQVPTLRTVGPLPAPRRAHVRRHVRRARAVRRAPRRPAPVRRVLAPSRRNRPSAAAVSASPFTQSAPAPRQQQAAPRRQTAPAPRPAPAPAPRPAPRPAPKAPAPSEPPVLFDDSG